MSGNFTCVTCRVQYGDGEAQRIHYKSDWHRYNLKRKVASLPPVTEAFFSAKSTKLSTAKTISSENALTILRCALCNKNFATDNSLQSHLASKKHKEALSSVKRTSISTADDGQDSAAQQADEENVIVKIVKKKPSAEEKEKKSIHVKEIRAKRAKLVALRNNKAKADDEDDDDEDEEDNEWESDEDEDEDFDEAESAEVQTMEDEEAELPFGEGEAITSTSCLFCSSSSPTVEENLKHMSSTHSFFVPDLEFLVDVEGLLTYLGEKVGCGFLCLWCNEKGKAFHTVDSAQTHMRDKGHTKMFHEGNALFEYADFYDYRPSYPDYDPDKATETDMEVECGSKSSSIKDEEVDVEEVDGDGYTLVLPSGATVGHRSLLRYYKQSLNPRFHSSNAIVAKHRTAVQKLMSHYKALGWTGCTGEAAKVKARDIQFAQKAFHKNRMQIGVKANKLQTYFREQVMY